MAIITKIGGVATSGTSGVNNLFGSGSTGGGTPTTTPTILMSSSTTFGGNSLLVTNYGSACNYGQIRLEVTQDVGGLNITPTAEDFTIEIVATVALLKWEDSTTYAGGYSVKVFMVDMDSSPAETTSASSATGTYTKTIPSFKYYRVQARTASGANTSSTLAVSDIQLFATTNATGTQFTGVNNFYSEYMSGYTSGRDDMEASDGYNYSSYDGYKAFDNGVGIGSAWWSLIISANNIVNNYVQMEWLDQSQNSNSRWATSANFPDVGSIRVRVESNGSASHYEVMGSDTGAFNGEEHSYGLEQSSAGSYKISNA